MNDNEPKLSLDQQRKLEQLRHHLPAMHAFLLQRSAILPVIASLCIALLVIFSLDRNLLSITEGELKILVRVLLVLIPTSLFFHLAENHGGIQNTYKAIKDIMGEELIIEPNTVIKRLGRIILAYHAWILTAILSLVIMYVILLLWGWFD